MFYRDVPLFFSLCRAFDHVAFGMLKLFVLLSTENFPVSIIQNCCTPNTPAIPMWLALKEASHRSQN